MTAVGQKDSRHPRRHRLLALGKILIAAAIVVAIFVASAQQSSAGNAAVPPVPVVAGVGAPQNAGTGSKGAGSVDIGTTKYNPPTNAIYVSPSGNNDGNGSLGAPLRTIQSAIKRAVSGGTIVLRAGGYHEKLTIFDGKPLTVQSYPGEAAWLDGSSVVDGWTQDGKLWSRTWDLVFDSSPTYSRGVKDNSEEHWNFVTPEHPMAAHPDQLWWDDKPLTQVETIDQVTATSFYHDEKNGVLYLGADPSGHVILASDLQRALSIRAAGTVIRGIGIRRFAPSVPDLGAVTIERPDVTLENVVISECATTGLFIAAANATLRHVSATKNGMIGVVANFADNLVVDGLKASGNNSEWFNKAPVAGGMKLTRSRTVVISNSEFSHNNATGLWFDQSSRDIAITGSRMVGNQGHGIFLEISARAVVADNYIADNAYLGMKINDTSSVEIRNNVVVGNVTAISVLQDKRLKTDLTVPGHDARFMNDPEMTWLGTDVTIVGNTLVGNGDQALVWVEDYSRARSAKDYRLTVEGNLFARAENGDPQWIIAWMVTARGVTLFKSLDDFTRSTGQERSGREFRGKVDVGRTAGAKTVRPAVAGWVAETFSGFPAVAAALR